MHTLLLGKKYNVTEEGVSLLLVRQVGVSSAFICLNPLGKSRVQSYEGVFFYVCMCVFNYGRESIKVPKCLCI